MEEKNKKSLTHGESSVLVSCGVVIMTTRVVTMATQYCGFIMYWGVSVKGWWWTYDMLLESCNEFLTWRWPVHCTQGFMGTLTIIGLVSSFSSCVSYIFCRIPSVWSKRPPLLCDGLPYGQLLTTRYRRHPFYYTPQWISSDLIGREVIGQIPTVAL